MLVRTKENDTDGADLGQQQFSRAVAGNSICENLLDDNLFINILSNLGWIPALCKNSHVYIHLQREYRKGDAKK